MSEEELTKLCKEEFLKNIKEFIKSETIFIYVDNLEKENKKQKEVLDKIKKLELYEFDLDYDYEENPVEHYTPFFMREYIEKSLEEIE